MSDTLAALLISTIERFDCRLTRIEQLVGDKLDPLAHDVAGIKSNVEKIMAAIDDLIREVDEANTVMGSAAVMIAGLRDEIRANLHNPAQLAALASSLDAKANALMAAMGNSSESPSIGEPVPLPPPVVATPDPNRPDGTLPVDSSGNPVQLDSSGAPIGAPRPNDPATGQPVPDKPVAGSPVAPMGTGNAAGISTTSPAQPTDSTGSPQPKATP